MAGLIVRPALAADHRALEELCRATAMGSRIRMGFERDPDYFAGARVQAEDPCVWGFFEESGRAVGLFSAGSRRVWAGGEMPMRYLSDLRIHPDRQGSALLARGFRVLRREVFRPGEWAQTLVLEGNARALELLTSRRGGLPEYRPAGRYRSWLLPGQRVAAVAEIQVRRAGGADLVAMQQLLDATTQRRSFAPVLNLSELGSPVWRDLALDDFLIAERRGVLVGMVGLWDQSAFQRLRIQAYSPAITVLRPLWNVFSGVPLPKAGGHVPLRKATAIACRDEDPAILRALLAAALAGNDERLLLVGLSAEDPLVGGLKGLRGRKEFGRHFLVGWDGTPPEWREPFAFDVARI
ncbi:hypothetical protein HQ447_16620 [bacterium]|nr:hypothetical protein [bacterium]